MSRLFGKQNIATRLFIATAYTDSKDTQNIIDLVTLQRFSNCLVRERVYKFWIFLFLENRDLFRFSRKQYVTFKIFK